MTKRILLVLLASLAIGVQAFAQTVSGKVADAKGEAIPGASVIVKGTTTGTMTDLDGAYAINADSNATLVFSCIGYTTQEVTVGSQKAINVTLAEDSALLDEVVVVGYGTARKKDISGSIQSMNFAKDQNASSLPNPNALSALSSKIAGFSYAPTSSASGDNTSSMTIRGMNTIPTNMSASNQSVNKPLLIVDGVLSYDSINSINTADIESIDVLKDASAAAIYGSRAANGVIIITTKRGLSEKPQVNFNASVSFSDWANLPARVTDDEAFLKNRFYAKQAAGSDITKSDVFSMDDAMVQKLLNPTEYDAYKAGQKIDWVKEVSRLGVGQKYDLSVSGRSKKAAYYISGNYTRQQGILIGDDYEKMTVMSKLDVNVTDWLKVGLKANYLGGHSWGQTAAIQNAMYVSPYSYRYSRVEGFEDWHNSQPDGNITSPFIGGSSNSSLYTDKTSKSSNLNGVFYAQVDFPFLKGLQYKVTLQGQRNFGSSDSFVNEKAWVNTANKDQLSNPSQFAKNATGSSSSSWSTYWNIDNILSYTKDFGKNHIDAMVGYTSEHTNSEGLGTSFTGFTVPTTLGVYIQDKVIYDDAAGSSYTISRTRTESSSIGILARLNYNFANKYYVSGNFRRDGYSAFAAGHKWGNFFGASAAWVISNEDFIKNNVSWIDFLKLRASWGQNGSRSVSPYITASTVNNVVGNSGAQTSAWLGGKSAMGITATNLANSELTWATVNKADIGLDFSFFGSRLSGSIDGYWGTTTNMLLPRSVPYISGFSSTYDNAGLVTNNGVEVVLNSVNIAGDGRDKFRWETSLVFDHNTNCVKQLYGPGADGTEANDVANYLVTPESQYALIIGKPITAAYGMEKLGIFNSQDEINNYKNSKGELLMPDAKPGDLKFADSNGDGKVDTNDYTYLGCSDPLFTVNFGNTLSWKGFSLYFNFRWAQGDKTHFLGLDPYSYSVGTSGSQLAAVKPWTEENHSQTYPRYGYGNTYNYQYWTPRTFLKLKDLTFSYTLPEKAVKSIGLSGVRVYFAGTDLFTISKWTGIDPETGGTQPSGASSDRYTANSKGTYKTYSFGVNLTF